uniref:Multimeric flavodoxin WrbA n=1 Tax=uncultured bacterium pFosPlaG TaxID=491370 RepID=B0FB24_9BACT|nr:multimeric flavodoxin WrbA [uncultured bacterium pFosPlaG]
MKVLALNASPRKQGQSKTELMLNNLVKGMREAGADVEVINLRDKQIENCKGCFFCWTKTPGICVQKDDMTNELYPKLLASDLAIYGTPLYLSTVSASMKTFIDRTLPVLEPFFEKDNERIFHPYRHDRLKIVFLSVAAVPGDSVFDRLSSWANYLYAHSGKLVAEIYRSCSPALNLPLYQEKSQDILAAVTQAGHELVKSETILPDTMARIKQPIMDDDSFIELSNHIWEACIKNKMTINEYIEKKLMADSGV